ncbi:MAG: O-antigen ligase family protein, partial [Nitrososphaerales archaeon]
VYLALEPLGYVSPAYFNHAHNDYLELWLETGYAGAVLVGLFLAWLVWRAARAWSGLAANRRRALAAACTVAIGVLLAHSALDYPLRTETSAVLLAFACGVIA